MRKKSTEAGGSQEPTWATLEAFARQSMQRLLQRLLEEEVDELLGPGALRAARRRRCAAGLSQRARQAAAAEPEQRARSRCGGRGCAG